MAFPFSVYNIAYLAAEFKSQTQVYYNMIAKVTQKHFRQPEPIKSALRPAGLLHNFVEPGDPCP